MIHAALCLGVLSCTLSAIMLWQAAKIIHSYRQALQEKRRPDSSTLLARILVRSPWLIAFAAGAWLIAWGWNRST